MNMPLPEQELPSHLRDKGSIAPLFTNLQWLLIGLLILFIILWAIALSGLFGGKEKHISSAMKKGQYAKISIKDGKVTGNIDISVEEALKKTKDISTEIVAKNEPKPTPKTIEEKASKDKKPTTKHTTKKPIEHIKISEQAKQPTEHIKPAEHIKPHKEINTDKHSEINQSNHNEAKVIKSRDFMQPAPNPDMIEKHPKYGSLPRRDNNGETPWAYYARPSNAKKNQLVIALMITGLGLSEIYTKAAINLPADISLSFSPYDRDIINRTKEARKVGHEVWLDAPMQFADYPASDPGPLGLTKNASDDENHSRLLKLLGRSVGYVGLVTPSNEVFSANKMMKNAHTELLDRGLLLLLRSRTYNPAEGTENILYVNREIDRDDSPEYWRQTFTELEAIARSYGYAIGVLAPTPGIFKALNAWHKQINPEKLALVPMSAIIGAKN